MPARRVNPALLVVLAVVVVYGAVAAWGRAHRPGGRWVGRTHCSWIGEPRFEIRPGLARVESIATVAHESVHVAECRAFGPVRYRWNTLFAASNLDMEVPAYCVAAKVRLKNGWTLRTVKQTVMEDMLAAMKDRVDSAAIGRALSRVCPELK